MWLTNIKNMTKKKTKSNRGRKPIQDKVKQVSVYARESEIEKCGGMDQAKEIAEQAIKTIAVL